MHYSYLLCAGSEAARARVVGIVGGSAGGGLLVLLLLVAIMFTVVCFILKQQKVYNLPANVEYRNSKTSDIVITTNAAYKSVQQTAADNVELQVVYDTAGPGESTNELQESNDNRDSKLIIEQNVAYESSAAAQISLNVAYNISNKSGKALINGNDHDDDKYDYI